MTDEILARLKEAQTACTQMDGLYLARLEVVNDGIRTIVICPGGPVNRFNTRVCSWQEIEQARLNPIIGAIQNAVFELEKGRELL